MSFTKKSIFILLCLFLFSPGVSANITEDYASLSLLEALTIAHKNNPKMVEMRKKILVSEAIQENAKKLENPELEVEVAKLAYDIKEQSKYDKDNLEGEVRFNQPIQTWGKRALRIGIAEDEKNQINFVYQDLWMNVSHKVKEQYAATQLHQKSIELSEDGLERAQRLLEQVNIKFNVGKARNHELARTKLEVSSARNELLNAETEYLVSLGELNILLGQSLQNEVHLTDALSTQKIKESLQNLMKIALNQRAGILNQNLEIKKREKQLKLAKRQRIPDMNLGLFVEREEKIYSAGVGVSFELPLWNQFQGDIKEASLEKEIAEIHLEALKKEVELEVYAAFKNAESAERTVENLEQAIKEANELLRIITGEYEEGETSFLSYLEGITSYKRTKHDYLKALASYANKVSLLELAIGKTLISKEEQL